MIKNNNYLDSLSKSLLNDVRSVLEGKSKACKCDNNCACGKEEKDEAEEEDEKEEKKEVKEAKKMKGEDPCWKGYEMIGTKKGKGGKEVPNCVPEETEIKEGEEKGGGYNATAVNKAISSSRQKIGGREAKKIHALLKGSSGYKSKDAPVKEEAEINEEVDFAKVRKQFDRNEDRNAHSVNAVLIAKHAGTEEHHKEAKDILKQHNKLGHLSGDLSNRRQALYKQLEKTDNYKKIFPEHNVKEEVEVVEAKAESPIKGTRLISKHEGKDGHHAEVRHNSEYNEFQVHHYENGKHMGEGPVSYHDTKADAKETAEYEVKNYRPKGGSLQKEEAEVVDNEFNRANYKHLIGKTYPNSKAPSYARVKEVKKLAKEEVELDEKLVGNQHKIDKNKNGKLDKQDFKMLRKEKPIEEKLNPSMGSAKYIDDFVKSKDPRFEGKTKKERIKMALGAYYGAKNEAVEIEEAEHGSKRDYAKHHIEVDGKYIATTTWARNAKEAEKRFLQAHPEHKGARITISKD